MKKLKRYIIPVLVILMTNFLNAQELKIGDKILNTKVYKVLGDTLINQDMTDLTKNKIVILEFWELYCVPCIEGMKHLDELYNKFHDNIIIIGVFQKAYDKVIPFIKLHRYPFTFLFDSQKELSSFFPHNGIPHSVLIDKEGMVRAITHPNQITEEVIRNIIQNKEFNLVKAKKDYETDNENLLYGFSMNRTLAGESCAHSLQVNTKNYWNGIRDSTVIIHKYSFTGMTVMELYKLAYNLPKSRIESDKSLDWINSEIGNLFNVNFKCTSSSTSSDDCYRKLQSQLDIAFNLKSKIISNKISCYYITDIITNDSIIQILPASSNGYNKKIKSTTTEFKITSDKLPSEEFSNNLEECIRYPIVLSDKLKGICLKISMDIYNHNGNVDTWINEFRRHGIVMEKKKTEISFLKIEMNQ
jgi:thiol-disulfide isomerase/thioredoxin